MYTYGRFTRRICDWYLLILLGMQIILSYFCLLYPDRLRGTPVRYQLFTPPNMRNPSADAVA